MPLRLFSMVMETKNKLIPSRKVLQIRLSKSLFNYQSCWNLVGFSTFQVNYFLIFSLLFDLMLHKNFMAQVTTRHFLINIYICITALTFDIKCVLANNLIVPMCHHVTFFADNKIWSRKFFVTHYTETFHYIIKINYFEAPGDPFQL